MSEEFGQNSLNRRAKQFYFGKYDAVVVSFDLQLYIIFVDDGLGYFSSVVLSDSKELCIIFEVKLNRYVIFDSQKVFKTFCIVLFSTVCN